MAHDFTIRVPNGIWSKRYDVITVGNEHTYIEKDEYKGVPNDEVFFFGYADGIFIKLLDARNVIMQCLVMDQYI